MEAIGNRAGDRFLDLAADERDLGIDIEIQGQARLAVVLAQPQIDGDIHRSLLDIDIDTPALLGNLPDVGLAQHDAITDALAHDVRKRQLVGVQRVADRDRETRVTLLRIDELGLAAAAQALVLVQKVILVGEHPHHGGGGMIEIEGFLELHLRFSS